MPKLPGHVSSAHKHVFCFERVSSVRSLTRVVGALPAIEIVCGIPEIHTTSISMH